MADPIIEIGHVQILLLLGVPAVAVVFSVRLGLGLAREISIGTARSLIQLTAVGLVIGQVFRYATWYSVLLLLGVMTLIAGFTGARRSGVGMPRLVTVLLVVLGGVTALTMIYITQVVLSVRSWDPRYLVPLGGMLLGNGMTAATLAIERLVADLKGGTRDVEVLLALGAVPKEAVRRIQQAAVRSAMMPTINTMMIVGIIQLPGMMTGQMLGGTPPFEAAMYQMLILVSIMFVTLLTSALMTSFVAARLFTDALQLDRAALGRLGS